MQDMKTFLTTLTFPFEKIWTLYMAAGTAFIGICFNVFLASQFHWVMTSSHPMFPFYVGANIMFILCFLILLLESLYQRRVVYFFQPLCRWIKTSDFHQLTYMEYNQMFSQIFPLKEHLSLFKKRYLPVLTCSRFLLILLYLSILFLGGTADYFFSFIPTVKTSFSYYHFIIMIALIIYLLLIMHLNTSKLPDMPHANKWIFFILMTIYIVVKSISFKQSYGYVTGHESYFQHMVDFTESAVLPLLLICLFFNIKQSGHICFDIQQKVTLYDTFMGTFISYSDILCSLEKDTEIHALLCSYSAYINKSEKIPVKTVTYSEEKMQWLFSQTELLREYCCDFSDEMLRRCRQIFLSLPDWSHCLLEDDFPDKMIKFLTSKDQ